MGNEPTAQEPLGEPRSQGDNPGNHGDGRSDLADGHPGHGDGRSDLADESGRPEVVEPPIPARRRRKSFLSRHLLGTITVSFVVVVLAVAGGAWLWFSSAESGSPGAGLVLTVSLGQSFSSVRSALVRSGVVTSNLAFELYVALHGTPTVEPGQYYLRKDDSFADVLGVLQGPPNVLTLQIPPGFTVAEVSGRLESAGYGDLGSTFAALAVSGTVRSHVPAFGVEEP